MDKKEELLQLNKEKLHELEKALVLENDANVKFTLKKQIEDLKVEIAKSRNISHNSQSDNFISRVAEACRMRESKKVHIKGYNQKFPF